MRSWRRTVNPARGHGSLSLVRGWKIEDFGDVRSPSLRPSEFPLSTKRVLTEYFWRNLFPPVKSCEVYCRTAGVVFAKCLNFGVSEVQALRYRQARRHGVRSNDHLVVILSKPGTTAWNDSREFKEESVNSGRGIALSEFQLRDMLARSANRQGRAGHNISKMAMATTVAARVNYGLAPVTVGRGCEGNVARGCEQSDQKRLLARSSKLSALCLHREVGRHSELSRPPHDRKIHCRLLSSIEMTLIDEKPPVAASPTSTTMTKSLAYEVVQGPLARWTEAGGKLNPETPTAVLVHGILGARKNWGSFARRLAQEFPNWQFLLVDLRCHGDSTLLSKRGPHTVASAARDVLQLVGQLKLTPRLLIGHSFGGKVVMSMADQATKPLARPVRVWVLDATPGKVYAGGDGEDHPEDLLATLKEMPAVVPSRRTVIDALSRKGFSLGIVQWMTTNLRPMKGSNGFSWVFDINGVVEMYRSYEETNLWPLVEGIPEGVHIDFLRAERSLHRWQHNDVERIRMAERIASREGAGVQLHILEDAGHWVHTDNPDGLFKILSSSFGMSRFSGLQQSKFRGPRDLLD